MLGLVLTEFLTMAAERYTPALANMVARHAQIGASDRPIASDRHYSHTNLIHMTAALAELSGESPERLLRIFGQHLFPRLLERCDDAAAPSALAAIAKQVPAVVRFYYP